jgi:hypothetical protein
VSTPYFATLDASLFGELRNSRRCLNRATCKLTTTLSENGCVATVSFRDIEQMKRKAYTSYNEEFCSSASAEKDSKKKVS